MAPTLYDVTNFITNWLIGVLVVAAVLALFSCLLAVINDEKLSIGGRCKILLRVFLSILGCGVPCLWPVLCYCYYRYNKMVKCLLCHKDVRKGKSHRRQCLSGQRMAYNFMPNSSLYTCARCDEPLKLWSVERLDAAFCTKCNTRITNTGDNLHLCFLCDKVLCSGHSRGVAPGSGPRTIEWGSSSFGVNWGDVADRYAAAAPVPAQTPRNGTQQPQPPPPEGSDLLPHYVPPPPSATTPSAPMLPGPSNPPGSLALPPYPSPKRDPPTNPSAPGAVEDQEDPDSPDLPPSYEAAMHYTKQGFH